MNKLEETRLVINVATDLKGAESNPATMIMLMDIAKSLAKIVDKLYKAESEE